MDKNIFYGVTNNYIYITEKEPITNVDWYLIPNTMMTSQSVNKFNEDDFSDKEKALEVLNSLYGRKVVLTNDPKLIADGVQEVSEDFMIWLAKNPIEVIELGINKRIVKGYSYGLNPDDEPPLEDYYDVIIPTKVYEFKVPEINDYLPNFIKQFDPEEGELNVDDWSALDFLAWLEINGFKIVKK